MRVAPIRTLQNYEKKDRITNYGLLFLRIGFSQHLKMWKAIVITSLLCVFATERSFAQPFWSVGPKLGYTFGNDGGVTIGVEASYFPTWGGYPYGFTLDLNHGQGHVSIHAGIETWYLIGIDIGPTLFFSPRNVNLGMSLIAWDGFFLYPYYEMGIPLSGEIYHGVGGYLKFPLGFESQTPAWGPFNPVG